MNIDFNEAAEILKNCDNVYILIHQSPDGDCIGSGTALYHMLRYMGKRARVVCSDEIPKRYAFMQEGYIDEEFTPEFIIASDVADIKLLGRYSEIYGDRVDLCIDHHISNTGYAAKTLVRPDASAACEVVYELIKILGIPADEHITTCIYTGIATDTGCFKYENTTARCHEIVAELKRTCPVNYAGINRNMFEVKSRARLKTERAVTDIMEYYLSGINTHFVYDIACNAYHGAFVVEVGVTIKQKDENSFKISMRSANKVNVSDICASLGGGGHIKAAGCLLHGTLDEVKKTIVDAVAKGIEKC